MKQLFDTSVLVAALVEVHEQHERTRPYLARARNGEVEMAVSTHTLAEVYSTLTRLAVSPRITPKQAQRTIREDVLSVAKVISLDASDYETAIKRMADLGLVSGAIYDALHVRAAEKAEVDQLLTCNGRDFRRMPPAAPVELVVL